MATTELRTDKLIIRLVRKLFFVTPPQLSYLEERQETIFQRREEIREVGQYSLDSEGLSEVRRAAGRVVGSDAYSEMFDKSLVAELKKEYANLPTPELGSPENMLQFQLAVLTLRLCSDYVNAIELYQCHESGFRQLLPRIFVRNDVTREIDWLAGRDAMSILLEKNFRERYELEEKRGGGF